MPEVLHVRNARIVTASLFMSSQIVKTRTVQVAGEPPQGGKNAQDKALLSLGHARIICQKTAPVLGLLSTVRKSQPKIAKSQPEKAENAA